MSKRNSAGGQFPPVAQIDRPLAMKANHQIIGGKPATVLYRQVGCNTGARGKLGFSMRDDPPTVIDGHGAIIEVANHQFTSQIPD
ncbi:TPA: hypothetical protein ACXNDR_003394 [Serratia marcescens]